MYTHSLVLNAITAIRRAIERGIDPRIDPDLQKYWLLIDEDMQELFISEIEGKHLTFENDTTKPTA